MQHSRFIDSNKNIQQTSKNFNKHQKKRNKNLVRFPQTRTLGLAQLSTLHFSSNRLFKIQLFGETRKKRYKNKSPNNVRQRHPKNASTKITTKLDGKLFSNKKKHKRKKKNFRSKCNNCRSPKLGDLKHQQKVRRVEFPIRIQNEARIFLRFYFVSRNTKITQKSQNKRMKN